MANRSPNGQNAHCKGIYREAYYLVKNGWHVMADHIPGFSSPPEIEGFTPDIYAIKAESTYILEIETSNSDDSEQHDAFRRYAKNFRNILFYGWIVDEAGCRVMKFE